MRDKSNIILIKYNMSTNSYTVLLKEYISENPYPTYEEMEEILSNNVQE